MNCNNNVTLTVTPAIIGHQSKAQFESHYYAPYSCQYLLGMIAECWQWASCPLERNKTSAYTIAIDDSIDDGFEKWKAWTNVSSKESAEVDISDVVLLIERVAGSAVLFPVEQP